MKPFQARVIRKPRRSWWRFALAVHVGKLVCLALIAWSICSVNFSFASCGDYVTWKGSQPMGDHSPASPATPSPCKNGNCQQAPANVPMPAPAPVQTSSSQQWATLLAVASVDFSRVELFAQTERLLLDAGHPPSIDHPPELL